MCFTWRAERQVLLTRQGNCTTLPDIKQDKIKMGMISIIQRYSFQAVLFTFILGLSFSKLNFAQNQNLRFEHLTSDDGLSHNYVRCIIQDDKGYMWFGTFDGLVKYDGYTFTVYQHQYDDRNSINSNIIRSLCKDKKGNLWIGTIIGLSLYDRDLDAFVNFSKDNGYCLGSFDARKIFEDSHDNLWIGTEQGLFFFDPQGNSCTQYLHHENDPNSIAGNDIRMIFEDSRGRLWISTGNGGLNIFDRETNTFRHVQHRKSDPGSLAGNNVYDIVEDEEGYVWFACFRDGLSRIHVDDLDNPVFINYRFDPKNRRGLHDNSLRALCADQDGGLWIGMQDGGLDCLRDDKTTFVHYENDSRNPTSLNNNSIYTLYQDKAGDLWVGTYTGGVNLLNKTRQVFQYYNYQQGDPNSLNNDHVWEFQEDDQGHIWIATDGGGLNKFNPKTGQFFHYNSKNTNLNSDAVLCICIDSQKEIWAGTWAGGFSLLNQKKKSFHAFTSENSDLSNNNVFDMVDDDYDNLWLATQNGLNRFSKKNRSFKVYTTENSDLVFDQIEVIKMDYNGHLLLGTVAGFAIFDPETENFTNYVHDPENKNTISNNFVTSIFEEDSVTIWIATTQGLNKLDRKSGQITRYLESDGLPNNLIFGIEKDDRGFLWISTNKGIARFNRETNRFSNYTQEDGLQGNTFIKKSHYKSRNGHIYFGGVNGFNVFNPDNVIDNKVIPPIEITDFQIFNKSVEIGAKDSPLKNHISQTEKINISYQQNVFSFQFAALNYNSSSKNEYAYKLEGFDKEWNYIGTTRKATYTNINPGKYVFRVKGSNNHGIWNEEGKSIHIVIMPPFWQTNWFRVIISVMVIGLLMGGYKIRTNRIRSRNRELERRVIERTAQLEASNKELEAFSYSVSHDLRAPLRGMNGFSQVLMEEYAGKLDKKGKDYLQRIQKASHRMDELIDSLLKLSRLTRSDINSKKVNLSLLVESVAGEFRQRDPERNVEIVIAENVWVIGDEALLGLMLKNLFDNAWKFTLKRQNAKIEFGTTRNEGKTVYFIKDNGIGLDMNYSENIFRAFQRQNVEYEGTGIGLTTVQRIVNRLGGRIWVDGKLNEGATFYFTLSS